MFLPVDYQNQIPQLVSPVVCEQQNANKPIHQAPSTEKKLNVVCNLVTNLVDTAQDGHLAINSKDNVQPIEQGSVLKSPMVSSHDKPNYSNNGPIVAQEEPISTEPKTVKGTFPEPCTNEEYNQVAVYGQGQSSGKKSKLDCIQSNNAPSDAIHCLTKDCDLTFNVRDDDLDQHIKLVHVENHENTIEDTMSEELTNCNEKIQSTTVSSSDQSPVVNNDDHKLQQQSTLQSNSDNAMIAVENQQKLPQPIASPNREQNVNHNTPAVIEPQPNTAKKVVWKSLSQHPVMFIINLGLNCFQLGCKEILPTEEQLAVPMWNEHHIRAAPCLIKDCKSFNNTKRIT